MPLLSWAGSDIPRSQSGTIRLERAKGQGSDIPKSASSTFRPDINRLSRTLSRKLSSRRGSTQEKRKRSPTLMREVLFADPLTAEQVEEALSNKDADVSQATEDSFHQLPESTILQITETILKKQGEPYVSRMTHLLARYPKANVGKIFARLMENPDRSVHGPATSSFYLYRGNHQDALLEELLQHPNGDIRSKGLKRLELFANESDHLSPYFAMGLADSDPKVRQKAVQALSNLKISTPRKSAETFAQLINHSNPQVIEGTQAALTQFIGSNPREMFQHLFTIIPKNAQTKLYPVINNYAGFDSEHFYTVAFNNSNFSGKAQETMLNCYADGCKELFVKIIRANQLTSEENAVLKQITSEPAPNKRASVLPLENSNSAGNKYKVQSYMKYILKNRSGPGTADLFREFLMDPELYPIAMEGLKSSSRTAAPHAIDREQDSQFRSQVLEALLDEKHNALQVRMGAASALMISKAANSHLLFQKAFLDSNPKVVENAASSLSQLSGHTSDDLAQIFKHLLEARDPKIRKLTSAALSKYNPGKTQEIIELFKRLLGDSHPETAALATQALRNYTVESESQNLFRALMSDRNPKIVEAAIHADQERSKSHSSEFKEMITAIKNNLTTFRKSKPVSHETHCP